MDDATLDAIEARAKAVPDGWNRWADWQHYQILGLVTPTKIDGWAHPEKRADAMERTEAAVEHITGMDPVTTLALVAEVRRLRADLASVCGERDLYFKRWVNGTSHRDEMAARLEKVRTYAKDREAHGRRGRTVHSARIASDLFAIIDRGEA